MKRYFSFLLTIVLTASLLLGIAVPSFADDPAPEDKQSMWQTRIEDWSNAFAAPFDVESIAGISFKEAKEFAAECLKGNYSDLALALQEAYDSKSEEALLEAFSGEVLMIASQLFCDDGEALMMFLSSYSANIANNMLVYYRAENEASGLTKDVLAYFDQHQQEIMEKLSKKLGSANLQASMLRAPLQVYVTNNQMSIEGILYQLETGKIPYENKVKLIEDYLSSTLKNLVYIILTQNGMSRFVNLFDAEIEAFAAEYAPILAENYRSFLATMLSNGSYLFLLIMLAEAAAIVLLGVNLRKKNTILKNAGVTPAVYTDDSEE